MRILILSISLAMSASVASAQDEPVLPSGDRLLDRLEAAEAKAVPASWPAKVPFLAGLRPYARAKFTQSIATTNNRPSIERIPRALTKPKWQVSGGMEGIDKSLWRSDVYKLVPGDQYVYTGMIQVKNSFGFYQPELGYQHNYPDGTVFVDHLTNEWSGKTFELRVAEKENGEWRRYVAFRDKAERPEGYAGLRGVTCASCHSGAEKPGSGGYSEGLVAGGDSIFSDGFPRLER